MTTSAPDRGKGILELAWPLAVSFTMRSLFNFVDTFYAGTLGDASIAAIGLTIPLEFIFIATWVGTSNALTSLLSRALGAREQPRIEQLIRACRRLVIAVAPVFCGLGAAVYLLAPHLGFEPEVARAFAIYAGTVTAGMGLTAFWSIIPDSIVKAHHDTRTTMVAGILSNVLNVGLNTLFLFAFHWGIFGIAFSTVVSRFAGLSYSLWRARRLEHARVTGWLKEPKRIQPGVYAQPIRRLLRLGVPSSLGYLLMATESTIVAGLLAGLPDAKESIAAWSIFFRFAMFAITPIIAGSVALLPFVARAWGRQDLAAIRAGVRTLSLAGAGAIVFVIAPIYLGFAGPILGLLTSDPKTHALGVFSLRLAPLASLAALPFMLTRPVFEGMQRSVPGMLVAVLRYLVLTLPFAYGGRLLALRLGRSGYEGVLCGLVAASAISSTVFFLWGRRFVAEKEGQLA